MKERPILFSAPMIKALLAGTKMQTRRIAKPKTEPWKNHYMEGGCHQSDWRPHQHEDGSWWWCSTHAADEPFGKCQYGVPGDRLWVRETWRTFERPEDGVDGVLFFADGAFVEIPNTREASDLWLDDHKNGRHGDDWRPSIYMRRWASRITLEVTEVRVQRLQDISEEDAKAEGVTIDPQQGLLNGKPATLYPITHKQAFSWLWDAINGDRAAWATNPWTWCVSFKRLEVRRG